MKIIFLSAVVFIYGYFCDLCLFICKNTAHKKLEQGIPLTGAGLVFMSNFANRSLAHWKRLEKRLILAIDLKQNS